jgi:DNA-directed RNA polymerase specialized sigma24 family protein
MNDEIIDLLDSHDWSASILKLTAYAVSLCRLKRIALSSGLEPEDLVMEAIEKVYSGERNWNHLLEPDLHRFLLSVVKSILSNKSTSKDARIQGRMSEGGMAMVPAYDEAESEFYVKQLDAAINDEMKGDVELCLVYKAVKDGCSPKEIAEDYAIDIETIHNAKKRLRRLVFNVIKKLTKTNNK